MRAGNGTILLSCALLSLFGACHEAMAFEGSSYNSASGNFPAQTGAVTAPGVPFRGSGSGYGVTGGAGSIDNSLIAQDGGQGYPGQGYGQNPPLRAPMEQGYASYGGPPQGGPGAPYAGPQYAQPPYQGNYHVPPANYYQPQNADPQYGGPSQIYSDRQIYAPAGLVLPVSLQTSISTQVAKQGDYIQGTISQNVSLGGRGYIPAGTQVVGTVSDSEAGRRLSRSGELSLQFNSLRLPNGQTIPITAHLMGDLGKYTNKGSNGNDVYRGEGWGTKLGQTALRGGLGAGLGAGLGTAVGAIAGGGMGAGRGAWSGTAIGGGLGLADMLMRKGKDVIIPTGTAMQIQLDQPADLGGGGPPPSQYPGQPYTGNY